LEEKDELPIEMERINDPDDFCHGSMTWHLVQIIFAMDYLKLV
jgi:hypothetical protein